MLPDTANGGRSERVYSQLRAVGSVVVALLVVVSGTLGVATAAVPADGPSDAPQLSADTPSDGASTSQSLVSGGHPSRSLSGGADTSQRLSGGAPTAQSLSGSAGPASNHMTLVTGTVEYQARNGTMVPARQVRVDIRKNGLTNPVIASTRTNDSGQYAVRIDVAAHENSPGNQQLNVKVQAEAANPAVEVIGFASTRYEVETTGQIQVGANRATFDLQATSVERRHAFQAADWALEARRFHKSTAGFAPRQVRIDLNATLSGDRYQSPLDKITLDTNWGNRKNFTVYHEYGHATLDGLYDHTGWKIPKFNTWGINTDEGWIPCHVSYSETSTSYAWYEGFAFLTEAAVNGSAGTDGLDLEGSHYFNQSQTHPECHDGDASPNPDYDGAKVEGAVASILWDLYDGKNERHDDINTSLREIYATVSKTEVKSSIAKRNTKQVENINTFWNQYVNESNHAELGRIYFEYGIQKPDRFEGNDSPSAAATIGHGVTNLSKLSGGYPIDGYNASGGAQLNYGDSADHYEFPAQKNEWVTIEVNSTQGDTVPDVWVYGPGGNKVASSVGTATNKSVSFRAPKDGTFAQDPDQYRLQVKKHGGSGRDAATYTFDIEVKPADKFDDTYEDNERLGGATSLSQGYYGNLQLVDVDATDVYAIRVGQDESIGAKASFNHSKTNIDLTLYGPYAGRPANAQVLARNASTTDGERIVYNPRRAGTYYLKVNDSGLSRLNASYDLDVETPDQPLQRYEDNDRRGSATNLTKIMQNTASRSDQAGTVVSGYTPDDPDYYEITLGRNENFKFTLTNGSNVEPAVFDAKGNRLERGDLVGSPETFDHSSGGTYYLKVRDTADTSTWEPQYELKVAYGRGVGSDHLEPNNDFDAATAATPTIPNSVPGVTAVGGTGTKSWTNNEHALAVDGTEYDTDYYEVKLDAGDTLTATVDYARRVSGRPAVEVIGPARTKRSSSAPGSVRKVSMTASRNGLYYVEVTDASNPAAKIPYDLTIEKKTSITSGRQLNPTTQVNLQHLQLKVNRYTGPAGTGSGFGFGSVKVGVNSGQAPCTLQKEKTFSRTVSVSGGTSTKVGRTRSVPISYANPCKVVVLITGPQKSKLNAYATLDGSRPGPNNFQVAGQQAGSAERLVIKPSDGLTSGATLTVLARGYPVAGTYDVKVKVYTR